MITVAQSVSAAFSGSNVSITLPGVQAGSAIVVGAFGLSTNVPAFACADPTAYADLIALPYQATGSGQYMFYDLALLTNATAGTHNITGTNGSSVAGFACAFELRNVATATLLDVKAVSVGAASTGNTAPVASTNEIAISILGYKSSVNGPITLPAGFTNIYEQTNGTVANCKGSIDYLTPVAAGAQSASYGSGTPIGGSAIVVLKGASSGVVTASVKRLSLLGVGQ